MTGFGFRSGLTGAVLLAMSLGACTDKTPGIDNVDTPMENFTADQIYERGEYEVSKNHYAVGAKYFAEIERLYPYSDWAKRGLIMQAFAQHKAKNYDESRQAAQRFLDFYPSDDDAAYAQYLLALSYYDQIDEVGRDQGLTFQALQALRQVIERYPGSPYAKSAMMKFDLAFDHLAGKEMEVGRYYLKRDHFAAAINRFRTVVEQFQTTSHTPEALERLVEAYLSLGLTDEAQTAGAILGHNFRSSEWYDHAYKLLTDKGLEMKPAGNNWLSAIYRQTVKGEWL
ncbi:outer membrane protein assembly factor BamD [Pseudooceanicola sp. CBS1P-1]|uniref:Outer membrane protein assembly factor BamD n=1 Tax=Pseudooceanicola albus TaxID=2692189 RepID=A0A6L7G154_9RHOB|nr:MULTISPECIES: outer membrane protein assembly factor BamD [Pseudooceanicola]MBT9382576.1 outer membrane protein assembly factor BamD [Pseudooceanicola endophyticus]MXN17117.1 outer membrane protein assembly factor BamD [Pseudooceanicola albus]